MKEFIYGLRARPMHVGAVPDGHVSWMAPEKVPMSIRKEWDKRDFRHGIIGYKNQLSDKAISQYELIDLNESPLEKQWDTFVEFCSDLLDAEIEYEEFVADYVHPKGEARTFNPLHKMKPIDFFKLLAKKGFPGNMKGLEKFYNQL